MYYTNLNAKSITHSKKFWKTTKPFFSDKGANKNDITLIDGNTNFQEDSEVARIFSDFFSDAVKDLNISVPKEHIYEGSCVLCDPIDRIISKYQYHPSIKLINDSVVKGKFSFTLVSQSDIEKEIVALDGKKASMASSILTKFLKENINVCSQPLTMIISNSILNSSFDMGALNLQISYLHIRWMMLQIRKTIET